jgi:hypothetical protein
MARAAGSGCRVRRFWWLMSRGGWPAPGLATIPRHCDLALACRLCLGRECPEEPETPGGTAIAMRRGLLIVVGALIAIAGVIWALQGFGFVGGSSMTGATLWAVIGPLAALVGLAMIVTGLRVPR